MKLKIITIGKIKNKNILLEIEEIKKRMPKLEIIELKEVKDSNTEIIKKKEYELFKKYLNSKNDIKILLWEYGKDYTTQKFYEKIKSLNKDITLFITGAFGANDDMKNSCNLYLSLSKMTFTHEMARLMLIEQLYRVQCFERNIPYTK